MYEEAAYNVRLYTLPTD